MFGGGIYSRRLIAFFFKQKLFFIFVVCDYISIVPDKDLKILIKNL